MIEIMLKNIEKYYGADKILENVSFEVNKGERVGVVGRNGTGKTTIFKIICGIENYDNGSLVIRKESTVGYLDQIPNYNDTYKAINVLEDVFSEAFRINSEMKDMEREMAVAKGAELESLVKRYGRLQQLFEHSGGYEFEERINRICIGLKITHLRERIFNTLSGGEKTTVILAKILLQNPDILLLDEPSNHLDMDSIEWLEQYLNEYKGTFLIISHDRYFLDKVVNKIIEIEDGENNIYHGNYSYFVEERERRLTEEFEQYEDQQKKIKAIEKTIKDLKDWGRRSDNNKFFRRAASMQKRLDKIERLDRPILERNKMKLKFSSSGRSGKEVLVLRKLSKRFDDKVLINEADLKVEYGERLSIIGKNGAGKSTLIKIILGQYNADSGQIIIGSNVNIGYLAQDINFIAKDKTVIDVFRESYEVDEGTARGILAKFLFYGQDVFKNAANLSGGEKSRLKLCQLMHSDVNLLILDEPTNHLDIDSREMLEEALSEFKGTIIFISHDRYFINKVADTIAELNDKKLVSYNGNYDYYKEKKNDMAPAQQKSTDLSKDIKKENTKPKRPVDENKKREIQLKKLEIKISEKEESLKELDAKMENAQSDYAQLDELYKEQATLQTELDELMKEWIELSGS